MADAIIVRHAKVHNLKNISVTIPRDQLVVICGLSGSGKSTLAFDTLFAEGQRRYVESLSAYARQFLGQLDRPDVESIEGLSPAIAIEQKSVGHNPRSTVGTITEIYDYLRLLYARLGTVNCPHGHGPIQRRDPVSIVDDLLTRYAGKEIMLLAPAVTGRKGEYRELFERLRGEGLVRVMVDGKVFRLDEPIKLDKQKKHTVDVVIDRLAVRAESKNRLTDSLATALKLGDERVKIIAGEQHEMLGTKFACLTCGFTLEELTPRAFSFNSPYGACPTCGGLGVELKMDPALVIPDPTRALRHGALAPFQGTSGYTFTIIAALGKQYGFTLDMPYEKLSERAKQVLLYGTDERIPVEWKSANFDGRAQHRWEGVMNSLERRYRETKSEEQRESYRRYMSETPCHACGGKRLKPEILAVTVGGKNIVDLCALTVARALAFIEECRKSLVKDETGRQAVFQPIYREVSKRLQFLINVGLDYLTLDRSAATLAGGEGQRIRLATQLGSALVGVLYILDEPSIGLHPRDNDRLLIALRDLQKIGNTVLVVEHDEDTIMAADYVVELGPGAGEHGGEVVAVGTPAQIVKNKKSPTGAFLAGRQHVFRRARQTEFPAEFMTVRGANEHNLKNLDVQFPFGRFICLTGVSGSGKSTLLNDIMFPWLQRKLLQARAPVGRCRDIENWQRIDKIIDVDQSPIGRTPRSNPATYTGMFNAIRDLFAQTPEAKARGYAPGRFSFNVRGGRCETCEGAGTLCVEMHFLPEVYVTCHACHGARYNRDTLEVKFKGYSIADVLNMTVDRACEVFRHHGQIYNKLETLARVGLGYIRLGQAATTLSGGEAQRVKLATELSRRSTGKTLYILDEPTTGLHFADIDKLLRVLDELVQRGNTVVVIEHNLDVIASADWIIDLGPEGGEGGGTLVAAGQYASVLQTKGSYTAAALRAWEKKHRA
ncbi:MAG TPA: excinuclease ABC subunit UvrA [bacterium]|nr:excinuclease ABC subunit UvrA [bacterium]